MRDATALFRDLWAAGLAAVDPARTLPRHLPQRPEQGRLVLFALGKAAATMAQAACMYRRFDIGLVIDRHGTPRPAGLPHEVEFRTGAHPVPDDASLANGEAALAFVASLRPEDRLVALISGGGSAMMAAPIAGLTLAAKQAATRTMLASGATIAEINSVRAALSRVKAGGLWRACGTHDVHLFAMSDIPGDDARYVASGPFSPDIADNRHAGAIMSRCGLALASPPAVSGMADNKGSPPPPVVVASSAMFLDAAAEHARKLGYGVTLLGDNLQGDAAAMARHHVSMAKAHRGPLPHLWLSGGEASVQVTNASAQGGRNLTFALAAALALDGVAGISAFAADSDGIDGNSDAAGAFASSQTVSRIRAAGFDPHHMLLDNRSHDAFSVAGSLFRPGVTGINVNDVRLIVRWDEQHSAMR